MNQLVPFGAHAAPAPPPDPGTYEPVDIIAVGMCSNTEEADMIRVKQPLGERGSLKWIQQTVNLNPKMLNDLILLKLAGVTTIVWRSPLVTDQYAEYRDLGFLERIGADQLAFELEKFWPSRGPQWDALARSDNGHVLLVEAKAH